MTRVQLAAVLGIGLRTVTDLEATGVLVPSIRGKGGRPSLYDLTSAVPAFVAHETTGKGAAVGDSHDARTRRDLAQAKFTELKIQREQGELVPLDEVQRQGLTYTKALSAQIRSLPRLAVLQGIIVQSVEPLLAGLCRDILTEISSWNLGGAEKRAAEEQQEA